MKDKWKIHPDIKIIRDSGSRLLRSARKAFRVMKLEKERKIVFYDI